MNPKNGESYEIDYIPRFFSMPSSYLYLETIIERDIFGGAYHDNFAELRYVGSKYNGGARRIVDYNGYELY